MGTLALNSTHRSSSHSNRETLNGVAGRPGSMKRPDSLSLETSVRLHLRVPLPPPAPHRERLWQRNAAQLTPGRWGRPG